MSVEIPPRCEEKVTTPHGHRITINNGPYSLPLDDKTKGILRMTMLGGGLVAA